MERIKEYIELPPEAAYKAHSDQEEITVNKKEDLVPADSQWPQNGHVVFQGYYTKYRPRLDFVLKDINLNIQAKEKIGIVGLTGAGKSSLTLALFRLIEADKSNIKIGGVNIASLPLHDLRSRLSIIPQDSVLFSTTLKLKLKLKSFGLCSDFEIWNAFQVSNLKDLVKGFANQLDKEVQQGGENFSIGRRQVLPQ